MSRLFAEARHRGNKCSTCSPVNIRHAHVCEYILQLCLFLCKHTLKQFFVLHSAGNIGTELSPSNAGMFITSDAGNNWRQVRRYVALHRGHLFYAAIVMSARRWLRQTCVLSIFTDADFWWGAQRLVPRQWRGDAGGLAFDGAYSTPMVGNSCRCDCSR